MEMVDILALVATIGALGYLLDATIRRERQMAVRWKAEREEYEQQLLRLREFLKLATSVAATVAVWNQDVCGPTMTISIDPDAEDGSRLLV